MMKTPGAELGLSLRNSAVGTLFRIVSGETASIQKGDSFRVQIPQLVQGRAIITLNGQSITIDGLPKPLEGKIVTFRLTNSGSLPALEIIKPAMHSSGQPVQTIKNVGVAQNFTSALKADPSTAVKTEALIVHGKGKRGAAPIQASTQKDIPIRSAILTSPATELLKQKGGFQAIVTQASGKKAVLTQVPAPSSVIESKAKATVAKTAHAVANLNLPTAAIIKQGKTETVQIRIENLSAPVTKGEQLLVQIKSADQSKNPELILKSATRISPPSAASQSKASQSITASKADPVSRPAIPESGLLTAKVEQRLSNGKIAFQWQGQQFEAPAPSTVKPGDMLLLKSVQGGKTPTLEVIDLVKNLSEKAITLFKQRIAMSEPLSQVLRNLTAPSSPASANERPLPQPVTTQLGALTTLLENYTVTANKPLDGHRLASMIRNSGQLYEALLGREQQSGERSAPQTTQKDIKAVLLKLVELTQSMDRTSRTMNILQASEQGAARIESQQAINLLAFQQAEPVRIEFPLIMQGMLSAVQMAISMEMAADYETDIEAEKSSSDTFNILFALELSQLGSVKVDARITSHSVHATIYSEMSEARHLFQEHISRLTERLEALGFNDVQLSTSSGNELIEEKKESFSRLQLGLPMSKGLLDVTG
ncbi:MAG: flagellar hook-length control protein FliK [Mariprofundaceae bacterium]